MLQLALFGFFFHDCRATPRPRTSIIAEETKVAPFFASF
jgi:hypothetical protein